jgi:TetR/AcrR family transcriptional repressor of nem operon
MARKKEYIEEEVIEKAMNLFWRQGYEATSVRMLEKEMGINQFSIYSSFGSKKGVFLQSIECYKKKLRGIISKLESGTRGLEDIKQFFFDFLEFSKENNIVKGCLMVNTINELGYDVDPEIRSNILDFTNNLISIYEKELSISSDKDAETIAKQATFISVTITGMMIAAKVLSTSQIEDFMTVTFSNL